METTDTGINGSSGHLLPDDLLLEILPRLSLCSLHRCFAVCKAWKESLVPIALSRRSHHHTSDFALLARTYDIDFPDYHLFIPEDGNHVHLKRDFGRKLVVSDTCNGLWLLHPQIVRKIDPLYVSNFLTSKTVPLPVINLCPSYYQFSMIVFDPQVSSNYQVVIFGGQSSWRSDGEKMFEQMHLFSSQTGKWQSLNLRVKTPTRNVLVKVNAGCGCSLTFCVNGYAYRLGECNRYPQYYSISSVFEFDIENELVEYLDFPRELSTLEIYNANLKLDVIKGNLVYVYAKRAYTIMWRLEHDAADHSRRLWTSWYRIEMSTFSNQIAWNTRSCTIAFPGPYQEHGAIFFVEDGCLWCFSLKDHKRVFMGNIEPALFPESCWFYSFRLATFSCCAHDPDFSH